MTDTFRSKKMSHWEAGNWLRRFYHALDHHDDLKIRFKKDMADPRGKVTRPIFGIPGNIVGFYDPDVLEEGGGHQIFINPSRRSYGSVPKGLIHELLHHIEPDWTEEQVKEHENLIYEALSDRQLWNLMKRVFSR